MIIRPRFLTRLSFAFIAVTESPVVSSMRISAPASFEDAAAILSQSSFCSLPVRKRWLSTIASLESTRETSCSADISSENIQTVFFVDIATFVPMLRQKLVLPIPGRAPTRIRSELPIPASRLSSPENPVFVP